MTSAEEIVAAVRRSELSLAEQVSQWEALPYGVAYWSDAFPASADANQLRDVWLADVDGETAYERAEAWFAECGATCGRWTPASGQAEGPVAKVLAARGWRRVEMAAFGLSRWAWMEDPARPEARILPARAMPKAFRATFDAGTSHDADLAAERLNDSRSDVFVAVRNGTPAGRIGYLQVGDVARLTEVYVLPASRGAGVARAMVSHVLQLARRLLPKALVASCRADDAAATAFLSHCGFSREGETVQFERGA